MGWPYETILKSITYNGNEIRYSKFWDRCEKALGIAMSLNGMLIRYIDDPNETLQLTAVIENPAAIKYIKNPTLATTVAAG